MLTGFFLVKICLHKTENNMKIIVMFQNIYEDAAFLGILTGFFLIQICK